MTLVRRHLAISLALALPAALLIVFVVDLFERRHSLVTSNFATSRRLGPALSQINDLVFDSTTGSLRFCDVIGHLVAVDVATGERAIVSR